MKPSCIRVIKSTSEWLRINRFSFSTIISFHQHVVVDQHVRPSVVYSPTLLSQGLRNGFFKFLLHEVIASVTVFFSSTVLVDPRERFVTAKVDAVILLYVHRS